MSDLVLDPTRPAARSRRTILAAALGGLAGAVATTLGRPTATRAAAGGNLILGASNDSGTAQTTLTNAGLGAAFTLKTTNTAGGATGIFGWSSQTGTGSTRGVYGKADGSNSYGVFARNSAGSTGTGAALFAEGNSNMGIVATSSGLAVIAATSSSTLDDATAVEGVLSSTEPGAYSAAVRGRNAGTGENGIGVWGSQDGTGWGVYGSTVEGTGVYGSAISGIGVTGESSNWYGVHGRGTGIGGRGVLAESSSDYGLVALSTSGIAALIDGDLWVNRGMTMVEGSEPAAPPSNRGTLFLRDNGSSKTQLCIKFSDSAIVVIATQP